MINGIELSRLRNADYLQLMKNFLSLVGANDPATLNVKTAHDALRSQVEGLETLFRISQASEITEEIFAIDLRRDDAIAGISKVVEGYTSHFNPVVRTAAKKLEKHLELYGPEIPKLNYQAETAAISGILRGWENDPELTAALAALSLADWKSELQDANTLFDAKYVQRTQEYGGANPNTLKSERVETNQVYYNLRDRISALAIVNGIGAYQKTINEANALIDQYEQLIKNRTVEESEAPEKPKEPEA